jgi:hypothetical protein
VLLSLNQLRAVEPKLVLFAICFFLFSDQLERVAERFKKEVLTFKHHVLIIKYIGKNKRKKYLFLDWTR